MTFFARAARPRLAAAVWPACVGALAVLYASVGGGAPARRSAIAWMMGSWGARLTVQTLYSRVPDGSLLTSLSSLPPFLFASNFRLLAFCVFLSLPALIAALNPELSLTAIELAACALWLIAFCGETTADRQWLRFHAEAGNASMACRAGLWRVLPKAHAVFEVLMWTAFGLFAFESPWGWIALSCPAAMLYLMFGVTRQSSGHQ